MTREWLTTELSQSNKESGAPEAIPTLSLACVWSPGSQGFHKFSAYIRTFITTTPCKGIDRIGALMGSRSMIHISTQVVLASLGW